MFSIGDVVCEDIQKPATATPLLLKKLLNSSKTVF